MEYHNGMKFSTKDRDNDKYSHGHCSEFEGGYGGWWFKFCHYSNLNGRYMGSSDRDVNGISWNHGYHDYRSYKTAEMKIRPV